MEQNKEMGIIYVLKNKANGRRYVGQTIQSLEVRLAQHVYDAYNGSSCPIHCAIRKYGWSGFEVAAGKVSVDQLSNFERKVIAHYNTFGAGGYNATSGGDGGWTSIPREEHDWLHRMWKSDWSLFDIASASGRAYETIRRMLRQSGVTESEFEERKLKCASIPIRKVVQISPETKRIVEVYCSVSEAMRSAGLENTYSISGVCSGARDRAAGSYWRYFEDVLGEDIESGLYSGKIPEVYVSPRKHDYEHIEKLFRMHRSREWVAGIVGTSATHIARILEAQGLSMENQKEMSVDAHCREVVQQDAKTGIEIQRFRSGADASRWLGLGRGAVGEAIRKGRKCKGYRWRYTDDSLNKT